MRISFVSLDFLLFLLFLIGLRGSNKSSNILMKDIVFRLWSVSLLVYYGTEKQEFGRLRKGNFRNSM